jgi:DNA mismatch endonuclease (patch repair protein)
MLSNRSEGTGPELLLLDAMRAAGLRFVAHARPLQGVVRRADAVFTLARVCVFMDGCFWHLCPEHSRPVRTNGDEYWNPKLLRNRERDRDTDSRLVVAGYAVVRLWEHEVKDAALLAAAVARLRELVDRRCGRAEVEGPDKEAAGAGGQGGEVGHSLQGVQGR